VKVAILVPDDGPFARYWQLLAAIASRAKTKILRAQIDGLRGKK